ncbi:hypothetical protein OCK74_22535 [Chitinophagaceae bacterium LB-8]|jgi:hypothetical protein|uniref:Uncharacterized protein n=1 Tax=Paraflavisolibacter caeni TaxID=2982496 RepID=A0A9X3B9F3_9BACT|nr:hypothetical protein [Paraflavisolibacter caeni]MCU7551915.1 hypothetical protein [Paraflavisolibacter caeni]
MLTAARIARIAMWVMVVAILATFFTSAAWVKIVWVVAAAVCLISILIVAYQKNRNRYR